MDYKNRVLQGFKRLFYNPIYIRETIEEIGLDELGIDRVLSAKGLKRAYLAIEKELETNPTYYREGSSLRRVIAYHFNKHAEERKNVKYSIVIVNQVEARINRVVWKDDVEAAGHDVSFYSRDHAILAAILFNKEFLKTKPKP